MGLEALLEKLSQGEATTQAVPPVPSPVPADGTRKPASIQAAPPVPAVPSENREGQGSIGKSETVSHSGLGPDREFLTELDRAAAATIWVARLADHGTAAEREELSRLVDVAIEVERSRDLATLRAAGCRLAELAWEVGRRVRGADGETEDRAERAAIQWAN